MLGCYSYLVVGTSLPPPPPPPCIVPLENTNEMTTHCLFFLNENNTIRRHPALR